VKKNQKMTEKPRPGLWELFSTMLLLGLQSFGGGTSTFYLIHETCIRRGWVSEEKFVRDWALAQISPGINLLKLTVMLGYQLRGWPGVFAASMGLMLPSAGVTVLMTAGFSVIRKQPLVQAAMRGILPATIGLSLAMGVNMAQPLLARAHREGPARLGIHLIILASAALLLGYSGLSPVVVLFISGAAAVALFWLVPIRAPQPAVEGEQ
jgi:chromate transporter